MHKRTLVVGPSRKTRGGISSVIKEYERSRLWTDFNCKWIETYIDRSNIYKILYFLRGYLIFICYLPASDIIHIHLSENTSAIRKSLFFWLSYWVGKKIVLHFHAFSPETSIKGKHMLIYKKLFLKADAVIVLSSYWKEEVISTFGDQVKIFVIYNPFSISKTALDNLDEKNRKPYILYVGTLNHRKGFEDLIRAFANIARNNTEWKIVFAGNGEIEKGQKLALSLGIENQIIFKGWVSGKIKEQLFLSASIFCLPSYAEGFPMSVIEAWSYGIPVITTPVGGLPDVIKHRQNAMIFQQGEIKQLTDYLSELISNKDLRLKLGKNSFKMTKDLFNIDIISNQISDLYRKLLSRNI